MKGGGGWKGEVDGRRRWMEGGGGWKREMDGRGRLMVGGGGWKGEVDGKIQISQSTKCTRMACSPGISSAGGDAKRP